MDQDVFRHAVLALAWAATPKDVVETLKRSPYLQSREVDDAITWAIQASESRQERAAFLAVRSFLKDLREERNVGTALQRAGCIPLAMSCPVEELLSQGGKMEPAEQEKKAKLLLRQARPESELVLHLLAKYFLGEALYRKQAAPRELNLRQAAEEVTWVVDASRSQPALRGTWKEAYQMLSRIWEEIARVDLPKNAAEIIGNYEQALQREDWNAAASEQARLLHSVGYLYTMRPTTDRYASIETGIQRLKEALAVLGDDDPHQSALSWNDLGNAYVERVAGEPVENFHWALYYYGLARKVHEKDAREIEHLARVEYNASVACRVLAEQIYDEVEADVHIAAGIEFAKKALRFYRSENNFRMLAKAQSEIGKLHYYHRAERDTHLLQAIVYLQAALGKIDPQQEAVHLGNTHDSLANAYSECMLGDRRHNLEKAVEHYHQALQIFDRDHYPQHWATVQNDLGATYVDLGRPVQAIECFQNASLVRKAERLPYDTRQTASNLGNLEFFRENWLAADLAYTEALDAAERLYQASYQEIGKKAEQSKRFLLTQRAAYTAAMRERSMKNIFKRNKNSGERALLILEQNKTRLLNERMQNREERPASVPQKVWHIYQAAAGRVRDARLPEANLERHSQPVIEDMEASPADIQTLRAALESVRTYEPDFLKEIGAAELRGLINDPRTALVAFCMTEVGSMGLILAHSGSVQSVPVPGFSLQRLHTWLHGKKGKGATGGAVGGAMGEGEGWLAACEAQRLDRMEALLKEIGRDLVWPVLRELEQSVDRLLILPTGGLYLVPFHAVPLPARGGRVIDRFEVVYAPSIKVMLKNRARGPRLLGEERHTALAVIGPEPAMDALNLRLFYADFMETALRRIEQGLEACPAVGKAAEKRTTRQETFTFLTGADCTKEKMLANAQKCTELHFYGHGNFNQANPLQSTLILADGERLTLGELQKQTGNLSSIRLLTLTACESGIPETEELPEEYVSLPGGFMQAGVPCVISSLWEVNEQASVLLLSFFHEYYHGGDNPAEALRKAQKRLRSITYRELKALPIFAAADAWGVQQLLNSFQKVPEAELDCQPYQHPYYWAAFSVNGTGRSGEE